MTKLVCKCGARFDEYNWDNSKKYTQCWKCWSEQPARITDLKGNNEGYASVKDWQESTL